MEFLLYEGFGVRTDFLTFKKTKGTYSTGKAELKGEERK
jgi:hypothetical protein